MDFLLVLVSYVKQGPKPLWQKEDRCKYVIFWEGEVVCSAMVSLDRALLSSYKLSIVTVLLSL